jgi:hypothetical protein
MFVQGYYVAHGTLLLSLQYSKNSQKRPESLGYDRALADDYLAGRDPGVGCILSLGRHLLRLLSGTEGPTAEPNRRASVRIAALVC